MGYYDAKKGYYVGDAGKSDYDRTIEAIQYYEKQGMADKAKSAVEYAKNKGYTEPNYAPSGSAYVNSGKTDTTNNTRNDNSNNYSSSRVSVPAQNNTQYYVPYEQELRDLIQSYPKYNPLSEAEMQSQAHNYANLQIDPQITSIGQSLQNAINAANAQTNEINAAYSTVGQTADRLLADAYQQGTANAVARGGGRSGAVEQSVAKLSQPIMEQVTQAEADKAAKLSNVATAKTAAQTAHDQAVQALEAQRGQLAAQQLAAIKELDYAKQLGRSDAILAATQRLSDVTNARNQFDNALLQQYTEIMGLIPGGVVETPNITGVSTTNNLTGSNLNSLIGLRSYVENNGGSVGWNPATGEVTVNNKKYSPAQLIQMGATMNGDSWYIPESALRGMM